MATEKKQTPPYGSFKTFMNFMERLKTHVVPSEVDRSVMTGMSGDSQTETLSALRFMQLLGPKDATTQALRDLVAAHGTDNWAPRLAEIVRKAYQPIILDLDVKTSTSQQLATRFRAAGVDGFMLQRCVRFYIAALKASKVPHSPLFRVPQAPRKQARNSKKTDSWDMRKPQRRKQANTTETVATRGTGGELPPGGYAEIPLPPGDGRKIVFPADINEADVEMIQVVLSAYASRRERG